MLFTAFTVLLLMKVFWHFGRVLVQL
jgi:hypothetical protein